MGYGSSAPTGLLPAWTAVVALLLLAGAVVWMVRAHLQAERFRIADERARRSPVADGVPLLGPEAGTDARLLQLSDLVNRGLLRADDAELVRRRILAEDADDPRTTGGADLP